MPLGLETVLAYAFSIIGVLLLLLTSLVVYVFLSLRREVRELAAEVQELRDVRIKLMHRGDCRQAMQAVSGRLDLNDKDVYLLQERMARVETKLHIGEVKCPR